MEAVEVAAATLGKVQVSAHMHISAFLYLHRIAAVVLPCLFSVFSSALLVCWSRPLAPLGPIFSCILMPF